MGTGIVVDAQKKGIMSIKVFRKILFLHLLSICCLTYTQNNYTKFDSTGHPKSLGLSFTVQYPANWVAQDGDRPHILKKFVLQNGDSMQILSIAVAPIHPKQFKKISSLTKKDWKSLERETTRYYGQYKNEYMKNIKRINHESQPAILYDSQFYGSRIGKDFYFSGKNMAVYYKNNHITLGCNVGSLTLNKKEVDKQLKRLQPVCDIFFNSLILMDQY